MNILNSKKDHKWGYKDTLFEMNKDNESISLKGNRYLICGYEMPYFLPYVRKELNAEELGNNIQQRKEYKLRKPILNENFINEIDKINYNYDDRDRLIHSHGQASASEIQYVLYSDENLEREVDIVLYPVSSEQIELIIKSANKNNVCLIPYGGGTNVSCALKCPKNETRMIASVDMRKLNKLISIDLENNLATFGAGITGSEMEKILLKYNYGLMKYV